VYDLKPPGPVLRTLSDAEIRQFYYEKYGAEKWEQEFGRNVSFIITTNTEAFKRYVTMGGVWCGFGCVPVLPGGWKRPIDQWAPSPVGKDRHPYRLT
jgi:hypothetical protein